MRFRKRPVALYLVPVPELQHVPSQRPVVAVEQPPLVGGPASTAAGTRIRKTAGPPPSPRIAQVLALEAPTVDDLGSYLADPDAGVRRAAVATLVEHLPDGYSAVLLHALHDDDGEVRRVAADGLRELVDVLPRPEVVAVHLKLPDPLVRSVAVYVPSLTRWADDPAARDALELALKDTDADERAYARRALSPGQRSSA